MDASFLNAELQGAIFTEAQLQNVSFWGAKLEKIEFYVTHLENAKFWDTELKDAKFTLAYLEKADFKTAININYVSFINNSWNILTNFESTDFANKTTEELTKIMGKAPTPLSE